MAGITGQGDTFDLPNYVGELFALTPEDTPLTTAIGGLTGGKETTSKDFEWQFYDLADAAQTVALEGANAPTAEARVRSSADNVTQIMHRAVETSYTKLAATGNHAGLAIVGTNPVTNEQDWQVEQALKGIKRDLEFSFIQGVYAKPANNSTERKTRGLLAAITTNVADVADVVATLSTSAATDDIIDTAAAHGLVAGNQVKFPTLTGGTGLVAGQTYYVVSTSLAAQTFRVSATLGGAPIDFAADITAGTVAKLGTLVEADIIGLLQTIWENGGIRESETATIIANAWGKRMLTSIFITGKGYAESSRNVGGVNLQTIETDFGRLNVMLNRFMPVHGIAVASLEQLAPVILNIPGKGFLFQEPLAKVGAAERTQIYGEIGLRVRQREGTRRADRHGHPGPGHQLDHDPRCHGRWGRLEQLPDGGRVEGPGGR